MTAASTIFFDNGRHMLRLDPCRPNPCTGGMTPSPLPISLGRPCRCRPVLLPSCSRPRRAYAPRTRASPRPLAPRPVVISAFTLPLLVPASARRGCRPRPRPSYHPLLSHPPRPAPFHGRRRAPPGLPARHHPGPGDPAPATAPVRATTIAPVPKTR